MSTNRSHPDRLALAPAVSAAAFVLLLFACSCALAQNVDPPTRDYRPTSLIARWSDTVRNTPRFLLGWNFGMAPSLAQNQELHINAAHSTDLQTMMNVMPDSTRIIFLDPNTTNYTYNYIFPVCNGMAAQYDPVAPVPASVQDFRPRYKDTSGAVWGFKYQAVGEVLGKPDTANVNYDRMLLRHNDLVSYNGGNPALVLAGPTQNNILFSDVWMYDYLNLAKGTYGLSQLFVRDIYRSSSIIAVPRPGHPGQLDTLRPDLDTAMRGGDTTVLWMGGDGTTEWWLAVNLRRLNNSNYGTSDTVLSLRVPYVIEYDTSNGSRHYDTLYAHFDSIAVAGNTYTDSTYGTMDKTLALNTGNGTTFYITRSMLPTVDPFHPALTDITLSAYFKLPEFYRKNRYDPPAGELVAPATLNTIPDWLLIPVLDSAGKTLAYRSPYLHSGSNAGMLSELPHLEKSGTAFVNMEVRYYGAADIGLDWLRFENRPTRLLLRGFKDFMLQKTGDWYNYMDNTLHLVPDHKFSIYRHYGFDECPSAYYRTQRYLNRFLEKAFAVENGPDFPGQYAQQTEAREMWRSWLGFGAHDPAPYLRYGDGGYPADTIGLFLNRGYRTQGLKLGYRGKKDTSGIFSVPDYETIYLYPGYGFSDPSLFHASDSLYTAVMFHAASDGLQAAIEAGLISMRTGHNILYNIIPFWANIWTLTNLGIGTLASPGLNLKSTVAAYNVHRPKTGEELRLMIWLALVHGAKGILYYEGSSSFAINPAKPADDPYIGLTRKNLRSDSTEGGDFLDNKDNLWNYTDVDSVAAASGITPNRLYIGTKSQYKEVQHCNEWVDANSSLLMRLQLLATYHKGYKLAQSRRDSTVDMSRFVDVSSIVPSLFSADTTTVSAFRVRRVHDRTGHVWAGGDEPFEDSTFFVVTLLRDTTISPDSVFFLSVLNRRTDPTIYYPAAGGTDLGDSIKFFSTVEFDSLRLNSRLSHYAEPKYAQAGAREITLPFNYSLPAAYGEGYALLHVQELGLPGGGLDTVIGQDSRLAVKFQPGEGKFLRVTVLKPGVLSPGLLAYSNQRKLVMEQSLFDSTQARYHMVYHTGSTGSRKVMYMRSLFFARNSNAENIKWESFPVDLAKSITDNTISKPATYSSLDCAYPSIVVRYDSADGMNKVYAVFACTSTAVSGSQSFIVENSFNADKKMSELLADQKDSGQVLAHAAGRNLDNWGTPVVSALARGNLYGWADSVQGIVLGYKHPQNTLVQSSIFTRWSASSDSCQHPSLSTYARIGLGENTCALVWQENNCIYYARPKVDVDPVISLESLVNATGITPPRNSNNTIARLSDVDCITYNRMPVVYRSIEPQTLFGRSFGDDRVFWEGKDSTKGRTKIYMRSVNSLDTFATPAHIVAAWYSALGSIWGNVNNLTQPDAAQGRCVYATLFGTYNASDSAYNLTFLSKPYFFPSSTLAKIYHIPLRYGYQATGTERLSEIEQAQITMERGAYPHLAARPRLSTSVNEWRQNRRVFETGTSPDIVSSAELFYRPTDVRGEDAVTPVPGFAKAVCHKYFLFEPYADNVPMPLVEPTVDYGTLATPTIRMYTDTLRTDWFPIGSATTVSFYAMGADTSLVRMELVKQSGGSRQTVSLDPATDSTARLIARTFTNGSGQKYRLELIKKDTNAQFTEDILIGQIPTLDSAGNPSFAKSGQERTESMAMTMTSLAREGRDRAVGLHALVYPNPADERIAISAYRIFDEQTAMTGPREVERLTLRISTAMGREVQRFEVLCGGVVQMETSSLPSGVYFVRVEGADRHNSLTSFIVRR